MPFPWGLLKSAPLSPSLALRGAMSSPHFFLRAKASDSQLADGGLTMPRQLLTRSHCRTFALSMLAVSLLALCGIQLAAQDNPSPEPTVSQAVRFAVSPPLRDLAKLPRAPHYGLHEALPVRRIPKPDLGVTVDPVEQNTLLAPAANYTIGLNFLGVGNGFPGYSVPDAPPDTNMAVGDTQVLQWVNVSFAIFNKFSGAVEVGPVDGKPPLFSALGAPCATSDSGDIIAQWDNAAHQWLLAQNVFNGPPYYACVAVSMTADATGRLLCLPVPVGQRLPRLSEVGSLEHHLGPNHEQLRPRRQRLRRSRSLCVREGEAPDWHSLPQTSLLPARAGWRQPVARRHRFPNESAFC